MSKSVLRKDKTCLNCRHVVPERFCPNCGQENIESRKTFHHLFIHFFEDLTHYENAFWRTIKNLLFKPGALTKEYLSGKRLSYLAPVRLYIFISFITFFLITVLPNTDYNLINAKKTTTTKSGTDKIISKTENVSIDELIESEKLKAQIEDSIQNNIAKNKLEKNKKHDSLFNFGYDSTEELDSMQKYGPVDEHLNEMEYWVVKKTLEVKKKNTNEELLEKFKESFVHNFSKTLFIYMPLFAFFLWIFHGKKRWYYFDHGIFTLHYFSFLLLIILIIFLFSKFLSLFGTSSTADTVIGVFDAIALLWMVYYFFPAHHRFYGETKMISFLKSISLFVINIFLIVFILLLFALYTFINIH